MAGGLYEGWIAELLGGPPPDEKRATCEQCAMVAAPGATPPPGLPQFDARSKCCTFYPDLPNFSVGMILGDKTGAGRAILRERFAAGTGVTPLGLMKPPLYATLYAHGGGDTFGRTRKMNCGFLDAQQRCAIWAYREATCRTYFCKLERGVASMKFWKALHQLLTLVERQLSEWCVLELDLGDEALELLFAQRAAQLRPQLTQKQLDEQADRDLLRAMWGRWAGREIEFYGECTRLVTALGWDAIVTRTGPDVAVWAGLVRRYHARLAGRSVPDALTLGRFALLGAGGGEVVLETYSKSDVLRLPAATLAALSRFDGRPTGEVVAELGLAEEALAALLDHEVLIPAASLVRRSAPPRS